MEFVYAEWATAILLLVLLVCTVLLNFSTLIFEKTIEKGDNNLKISVHETERSQRTQKSIESLPGPKPFPIKFIGNLFQLPRSNDAIIPKCFEWCREYGPCFRVTVFGKDFVVIANAPLAQSILESQKPEHLTKSDVYKFMNDLDGVAYTNGHSWQPMRKTASHAFHYKTLESRISYSNIHADKLGGYLADGGNDKHVIEHLIARCAVNIVVDSFISGPGSYSEADTLEYVKTWHRYGEITTYRMTHPWFSMDILWRQHSYGKEMTQIMTKLNKFTDILIKPHVDGNHPTGHIGSSSESAATLIPQLLNENLSVDRIRTEVLAMLSGYDAFFVGLLYILFLLAANPEHQQKCREEVDRLDELGEEDDNASTITSEKLAELKYLERCIYEALRMLTPTFLFGRKLESELELGNGVVLPAGTNALILPLIIHQMPEYYPNPEIFDPDRFLPENWSSRHPYSFIPFSAGPRVCIAMKTAVMSIKIITAKLLKQYVISTTDKLENIKFTVTLGMAPKNGLDLRFTSRADNRQN